MIKPFIDAMTVSPGGGLPVFNDSGSDSTASQNQLEDTSQSNIPTTSSQQSATSYDLPHPAVVSYKDKSVSHLY